MTRQAFAVFLFGVAIAAAGGGQTAGMSTAAAVDWKSAAFNVAISGDLDPSEPALERAKADAAEKIVSSFTASFLAAASPVLVDSSRTIGDLLSSDPDYYAWMHALALAAHRQEVTLSEDFSRVTARYGFPLYTTQGLASFLFPQTDAPIRRWLGYIASRVFSGLVIYAADPVPSVGESAEVAPVPALFPRLFDEEMNVIVDRSMMRPAALARWGMVGCADSVDDSVVLTRGGLHPLQVSARAVFGLNHTDIVIPTTAAHQLLSIPENIDLLKEGKIVVIYGGLK